MVSRGTWKSETPRTRYVTTVIENDTRRCTRGPSKNARKPRNRERGRVSADAPLVLAGSRLPGTEIRNFVRASGLLLSRKTPSFGRCLLFAVLPYGPGIHIRAYCFSEQ